ncbi:hypothetical protein M409DRAFT_69931 [Zasmidium cellare ATCC 36951]|uniref:Uncharacterized protein n=1 Tax=Zasmidium cellare ATCC 36951 TaxID=1080233 RepID=A0A6A6C6P6_ZASCE|nr:uncharacterized protein M409DRAFT_69931 [Zasmidium cellare ATCC 36951]KAF2161056.1 hypothetical protein M409DRAFT_69931 [Zasmidium cellare ATCC 36951]
MTFQQEFASWFAPKVPPTSEPPKIGDVAPTTTKLPLDNNKQTVIAFLRHCGCPFAEKTFLRLREAAKTHQDIDFIAVSQSEDGSTDKWLKSLPQYGTEPSNLQIVIDDKKEVYSKWGMGISSWAHVLAPGALSNLFTLAGEGIKNRPTETGSRWQMGGAYAVGENGRIKWGGPAPRADDVPDFEEVVKKLST